ncbi:MAG: phage head morphogenesis protein [Chitinophagales bacterium]|nr:phage head morphogenesis protein [Chitinophagales bacterium]
MTGRPHHHQKVSIDLASKPSKTLFKELLKQVESAYKNIHQNGYQVENLSEYRPLIEATNEIFSKALSAGVRDNVIPDKMMNALENDVFLFSALKTHAQLFEASRQLLTSDGTVKSFQQFSRDVEKIKKNYNQNYLQAEYNFAVASAQQAANWAEIEHGDEDYLLQYRTAEDDRVRDDHQALAGTTLPSTDAFWNEFYPPNGWNCRCVAVEVRNKDYKASDSEKAIAKGKKATESIGKNNENRLEIFRFNPGKQKVIFPPKHPYYPKGCGEDMSKLKGMTGIYLDAKKENCKAKKWAEEMRKEKIKESRSKATAEIKKWLDDNVKEEYYADNENLKTGKLHISKSTIMAVADHWSSPELKLMAKDLPNIKEIQWFDHSEINKQKSNWETKRMRGVTGYNYYMFEWKGETYTLNTEVIKDKYERIYAVNFFHKKFLKNKSES